MIKKILLISAIAFGLTCKSFAAETSLIGVVNFTTCITESKYGKNEQSQLENIKSQWTSLIEETDKELKDVSAKFEDQEYLDGLSPEAEEELKTKYRTLNEDMAKYQNQLYQVLSQANYFFVQKMQGYISKASEQVATKTNLNLVLNKEVCFYSKADLEITKQVIVEMDKNYDKDAKNKKISENQEPTEKTQETAMTEQTKK